MIYNNILSENKEGICYITINRPKQLNALNGATISELNQAISVVHHHQENILSQKQMVLAGAVKLP